MRTTVNIPDPLFEEVLKVSKAKSITSAIRLALEGYLDQKKREKLIKSFGSFPNWRVDLKKMRKNRDLSRL